MHSPTPPRQGTTWPALALTLNAFTWGVSWWPLRALQAQGLHPLWATAFIFAVAALAITWWRPQAWRQLLSTPSLWLLVAAIMEVIRRWHRRNLVGHGAEVQRLLAIARSDHV